MTDGRLGCVVPTLGTRPELLRQSLESLREAGFGEILVVAPKGVDLDSLLPVGLFDRYVAEAGAGLPAAINLGVRSLSSSVEYVTWLGDDDLVVSHGIRRSVDCLMSDPSIAMTFGNCEYIDHDGRKVWMNRFGNFAVRLLPIGPCLIPQPGAVIRRTSFDSVNGLSERLGWAFDLDLFLRLGRVGRLESIGSLVGKFRWHPDSLTVAGRRQSVREASAVRKSHLPAGLRRIAEVWEAPVRWFTYHARHLVSAHDGRRSDRA